METSIEEHKSQYENLRTCFLDNEKSLLKGIWQNLPSNFPEPYFSTDVFDVIDKAQEDYFDVVISDNRMPRMSGVNTLSKIREKNKNVKLILYTGFVTRTNEIKLCKENDIKIVKKLTGFTTLFKQILLLYIKETFKTNTLDFKNFDKVENFSFKIDVNLNTNKDHDVDEIIINSQVNKELIHTMSPLIDELIKDLESIETQDSIVHIGGKVVTISELTEHVKNMTSIGKLQVNYWFKGKAMLKEIEKKKSKENEVS